MRLNYSSRFWLYGPLALFLGLLAWVMSYWWVAAGLLDKKLNAINGHAVAPGISIRFGAKTISGFPFNLDVVFDGLSISGQGAHGPFRWTTEKFALHRLTYGRTEDIYEAAGNQSLSWTDGGGHGHALSFLPGALRASAVTDAKGLSRFDLEMMAAGGKDSDGAPFTALDAQFHMRRDPKTADALDLEVSAKDIKAQGNIARLFGDHITNLQIYATLTQGGAFGPLLAGREGWDQASADWHAKGGQAAIGPVTIASSGLSLSANSFGDAGNDLSGVLDPLY